MKLRHLLSLLGVLFLLSSPANARTIIGKVNSVTDGDTISVLDHGKPVKIRLYGIDTPEKGQAFGNKAKKITSSLIKGRQVKVQPITTDRYGRSVALVDVDGQSLNQLLIQNGYAYVYKKYCTMDFCSEWYRDQAKARQLKKGMWRDPHIVPPWEWRHSKRSAQNPNADKVPGSYHGNVNSKSFHKASCKHYNCKNCTKGFSSREMAIQAGYHPCGACKP